MDTIRFPDDFSIEIIKPKEASIWSNAWVLEALDRIVSLLPVSSDPESPAQVNYRCIRNEIRRRMQANVENFVRMELEFFSDINKETGSFDKEEDIPPEIDSVESADIALDVLADADDDLVFVGISPEEYTGIVFIVQGNQMKGYSYSNDVNGTSMVVTGVLLLIAGSIGSWLGSLILYGFGELIERAISIDSKLGKNASRSNKSGKQQENGGNVPVVEEKQGPVCELCGMECDKLTPIKVETRKGTKIKKVCNECLQANNSSQDTASGSVSGQIREVPESSEAEIQDVPEVDVSEQEMEREEIFVDGQCCICGIKMQNDEMTEWSNNKISIRSCDDCSKLIKTVNDEWLSGRKKEKAKQELKELLESGKVNEMAVPYIEEFVNNLK